MKVIEKLSIKCHMVSLFQRDHNTPLEVDVYVKMENCVSLFIFLICEICLYMF